SGPSPPPLGWFPRPSLPSFAIVVLFDKHVCWSVRVPEAEKNVAGRAGLERVNLEIAAAPLRRTTPGSGDEPGPLPGRRGERPAGSLEPDLSGNRGGENFPILPGDPFEG